MNSLSCFPLRGCSLPFNSEVTLQLIFTNRCSRSSVIQGLKSVRSAILRDLQFLPLPLRMTFSWTQPSHPSQLTQRAGSPNAVTEDWGLHGTKTIKQVVFSYHALKWEWGKCCCLFTSIWNNNFIFLITICLVAIISMYHHYYLMYTCPHRCKVKDPIFTFSLSNTVLA